MWTALSAEWKSSVSQRMLIRQGRRRQLSLDCRKSSPDPMASSSLQLSILR